MKTIKIMKWRIKKVKFTSAGSGYRKACEVVNDLNPDFSRNSWHYTQAYGRSWRFLSATKYRQYSIFESDFFYEICSS